MSVIIITGIDKTIEKLDWQKGARRAIGPAANHVKGKIASYPRQKRITRRSVYGFSFFSTRQRRKVMMMIREGKIPYKRTGSLGRRWSINVDINSISAKIGNVTPYAGYVQGDPDGSPGQSMYMGAKNWKSTVEVAKAEEKRVAKFFKQYIDQQINS